MRGGGAQRAQHRRLIPAPPSCPPPGILGEAPVLHHGDELHGGLDPHLRQPYQPGRMPAARQGRGGQRKQEQASLSRKQPGAQRTRPCQRGCPCRNLRRLKSYILPLAAHSSHPHLPPTLAQTSGQGSWLRLPPGVSSLAPKSPLEGLYIPSESSGITPTRPSHSPLMTLKKGTRPTYLRGTLPSKGAAVMVLGL